MATLSQLRRYATQVPAKSASLRIGMIPADGIGREVLPVSTSTLSRRIDVTDKPLPSQAARQVLEALGSDIPKPKFVDLDAGFEYFTRHGVALPEATIK